MQSPVNMRSRELAARRGGRGPVPPATSAVAPAVAPAITQAIMPGSAGDHLLVPELLKAAGVEFSEENFASRLDEPSYEPSDRRVVRIGGRVVAHAQAMHQMGWFGGALLPCGGLIDIAAMPEYRETELESQVLQATEELLRNSGAVVALCKTNRSELLTHAGWSRADCQGWSQVCVRDLLAHLSPQSKPSRRHAGPKVRVWSKVEIDALMPVYREASQNGWGAICRSEPYWRWLCCRHEDRVVLVACGRAKSKNAKTGETILAYAVIRGDHVVELRYRAGHELAGSLLLARVCQDAIEQDHHVLSLHTPATDPLHELLITAGGAWQTSCDNQLMVKLLNPEAWVEALALSWQSRLAKVEQRIPSVVKFRVGFRVGFHVGKQRYRLTISDTGPQLQSGVRTAKDVVCQPATFGALLLGCENPRSMIAQGKLDVRSEHIAQLLAILFPPVVYWQSPYDCNG